MVRTETKTDWYCRDCGEVFHGGYNTKKCLPCRSTNIEED